VLGKIVPYTWRSDWKWPITQGRKASSTNGQYRYHIVVHPSHYSNPCIGYQSLNVLSTNSPQWRTKFNYTHHNGQHQPICSLRSSNSVLLTVSSTKTATAARAFHVSNPTIWNSLSSVVKETSSQPQFLRRLKGHLFQRVFDWPWLPGASVSLPLLAMNLWRHI